MFSSAYKASAVFILGSLLIFMFPGCISPRVHTPNPYMELAAVEHIEAQIEREMARNDLPGVALFVMQGDEVLVNTGFGYEDLTNQKPTRANSFFQIGSISKCFTAVAVLKLVENERLSLETPIAKVLKNTPKSWKDVRVRHLLNHTSGIPEYTTLEDYGDLDFSDPTETGWDRVYEKIRELPLYFEPGSSGAYSNTNYHLLANIVEGVTGKPFHQHLHQFLKKKDIHGVMPLEMAGDNAAIGYRRVEGIYHPTPKINHRMVTGDGGLVATAPGLAKWLRALASGKILETTSWEAMTQGTEIPFLGEWNYGFGLDLRPLQGEPKYWHTGSMPGYAAAVAYYPRADLTIAVCTNTGDFHYPEQLEINIAREILDLESPIFAEVPLDDKHADRYLGVFDAGPLWLQIKYQEGRLVALVRDPRAYHGAVYSFSPLRYQGDGNFVGIMAPDSLTFRFDPNANTVAFDALGIRWIAQKVPIQIP